MWSSYSDIQVTERVPRRAPNVRYRPYPHPSWRHWANRRILAREESLSGARLLRYRQRRKMLATAFWCLAVSIAAIAIALLMIPS
jgi:hypothetical protein